MKWLTFKVQREPGFRFNLTDLGMVLFLSAISAALYQTFPENSLFWVPVYLGMSFFLFCNVFRIGNRLEPFWYIPFTLIAAICIYIFDLTLFWWLVMIVLEPLKWLLIFYRIKKDNYVGISSKLTHVENAD